jgi:hypothetical protein
VLEVDSRQGDYALHGDTLPRQSDHQRVELSARERVVSKYSVDVFGLVFQAKPSAPG